MNKPTGMLSPDDLRSAVERGEVIHVDVRLLAHRADDGAERALRQVRRAPHPLDLPADAVNAGLARA